MAEIDKDAFAAAFGMPAGGTPPAVAPTAPAAPAPAPVGAVDMDAFKAAFAAPAAPAAVAPAAVVSGPVPATRATIADGSYYADQRAAQARAIAAQPMTVAESAAQEAEANAQRDAAANLADYELVSREAQREMERIGDPKIIAEIRAISREDRVPVPFAVQTMMGMIADRSDQEFAALLEAEPALRELAMMAQRYPDFKGEGVGLATIIRAAQNARKRGEEVDKSTAWGDIQAGFLGLRAGFLAIGAVISNSRAVEAGQYIQDTQDAIPELNRLEAREVELTALLENPDVGTTERLDLVLEQAALNGRLFELRYQRDALESTKTAEKQAYRDVASLAIRAMALAAEASDFPTNPAAARMPTGDLRQALTEVFFDAPGVIRGLALRALPSMAPTILAAGAGLLVGGPVGAAALGGIAGGSVEFGASVQQGLQEELTKAGVDITNPEAVTAWAQQNEDTFADLVETAVARAVVIASFEAASAGLGGAVVRATAGASLVSRGATQVGVETGLEGFGEAGGSAVAQLLTEGTLPTAGQTMSELLAGGALGGPSAAVTVAAQVVREGLQGKAAVNAVNVALKDQLEQRAAAAADVSDRLRIARAAIEDVSIFARDPEAIRTLLETEDDGDVYIPAAEVNRLYQDGTLTDEDIQYLNAEEELTQQGEISGDVAVKRSSLLTMKGDAFAALADHVRTTPEGTTASEARSNLAGLESEAARLEAKMGQLVNLETEVEGLTTQIYDSIPAAPQVSRRQRQAVSRLLAQRYVTRAGLFGPEVTAQSLYEADQLTFQNQQATVAPSLEQAIKLGGGRGAAASAFMTELYATTAAHPFDGRISMIGMVGVDASAFGNEIHLGDIRNFGPARQGAGTAALTQLKALADKHGVKITGIAKVYDKRDGYVGTTKELVDWYKKNGFKIGQGSASEGYDITYTPDPSARAMDQGGLSFDQDPDAEEQLEVGVDVPDAIDGLVTIDAANALSQGQTWQTGRDLKLALQARLRSATAAAGVDVSQRTDANTEYLTRVGVKDALIALAQNPNAIGWYDEKTRQALAVMALSHPEIATDENARFAFTWALAVTSNGLKVGKNFELADRAYRVYKATGRMPSDLTGGQAQKAINDSLELFNSLADEWGMDTLRKFMQTNFTVKEIGSISSDLKPSGESAATVVRGSAIIGPKIGNGFFSNLYGNFDALTMDRWLVRTWGRWTGTLIMLNEPQIIASRTRLRAALTGVTTQEMGDALRAVVKTKTNKKTGVTTSTPIKPLDRDRLLAALEVATAEGATDQQIDDLALAIAKASMEPAFRTAMNALPDGEEFRKAGNALGKYNDGQKEAPEGPQERTYIREVFSGMLAELRQDPRYADLQMADLQAVLWYAEKRLYETAKEDVVITGEDVVGYEDEDAPDYANAAAAVARANGVPEPKIKAALKKESKDGRAAAARRSNAGVQAGGGQQAEAGGFTRSEKRDFIHTRAIYRVRSARVGDGAAWSYGSESKGTGGGVRLLKALGVRYVEIWKPGKSLGNVFRTNGIATPAFYELATGNPENAAAFVSALGAARDSIGALGRAVTLHPAEDYVGSRLFLTKDGKAGFAIKPDGDIVSVFSSKGTGAGRAIMETAIAAGGRKLDAFDTILPSFYAPHGFKAAARILWDDGHMLTDGWDKQAFAEFNNGEPDIVFMVSDPDHFGDYDQKATPLKKGENNYAAAVRAQTKAVTAVRDAEAARQQAGERLTLNQGENDGQVRPQQTGDRGGRPAGGRLAPLEGAPTVRGATGPDPRLVSVAETYARDNGIDLTRQAEYVNVDPARATRIAEAYEAMLDDPQNPEVKEAYQNMIAQTTAQYQALVEAGYKIWFIDAENDPDGYSDSPFNAMRDLRANQSMGVFPTTSGYGSGDVVLDVEANPLLEDTGIEWPFGGPDGPMKPVLANDLFRAVHDAFGHGLEGSGFRARGEENAWQAHIRLFTGSAAAAMTSETRGQNSWLNYNPTSGKTNQTAKVENTTFADQKIGLMPSWTWEEGRAGDMPAPAATPADRQTFEQPAWHGSPHLFSKFSTDYLGTGEGAQAFGWGLYFAGKKAVAEFYRDKLAGGPLGTKTYAAAEKYFGGYNQAAHRSDVLDFIARQNGNVGNIKSGLLRLADAMGRSGWNSDRAEADGVRALAEDDGYLAAVAEARGHLYQVEIPEDQELLDWDAPLSEQAPAVREKLAAAFGITRRAQADPTGAQIYTRLSVFRFGSERATSQALRWAGIPGHRFLDGGSRAAGAGSRNYVIYDDSRVEVSSYEQRQTGPQTNDRGAVGAPRGSYVPPTSMDPRNLINLTTTADVTTFVHEGGHMFLFQMMQDLADPRLTPEGRATLTKQVDSMRGWFGRNADQALADLKRMSESATKRAAGMPMGAERDQATLRAMRLTAAYNRAAQSGGPAYMQGVAASFMDPTAAGHDEAAEVVFHELWARGFEQYMGTGTAPTSELAKLFAQFSKFISTIYKSLRRLNVEITPEISDVFDRLLAGEEALQAERSGSIYQVPDAVFENATPAEAKRLRELAAAAESEASTMMQSRISSSLRAEEVDKRNARREQLTVELTEQVQNEPVYTAATIARTGITPNGDQKIGNGPLAYTEVAAFAGEATANAMPSGTVTGKKAKPKNPISLAMLRDLAGYDTTEQMLLELGNPNLETKQVKIKRLVQEQMIAEFGDDTDMSRFKDQAIEIAQNDKFQQLQVLLVRVLRRMAEAQMTTVAERQTEQQGAPAAKVDTAAGAAADTALAGATTPQDAIQAGLQKIRADVQKRANVKGRRAQRAASLTAATIRRGIDPAAIRLAALRFVGKSTVGTMTPLRFRQAAQRLTVKLEQAIAARNYTEAAALMEQRAMNLAVAEQAAIVQNKLETKRKAWSNRLNRTDKRLAASYDMDHVNTIRALMQPFGFAREASKNYNARAALSALSTTEPDLYNEMMMALTQYAQITLRVQQTHPKDPVKGLTVLEFEQMLDLADRLLAGARDSHGILINGERVAFTQIAAEVDANVQQRRKVQRTARREAVGRGTERMREIKKNLSTFKSFLRRIELWAKDIDNGNPLGPVTQYLVRPVMEAVDTYLAARQDPQRKLLALIKGNPGLQARRRITAPELGGYTFQSRGELLMAVLHTGNDSNKRKLLLGGAEDVDNRKKYVWGAEGKDGTLDTSRWDTFIQRMFDEGVITKADMDFVQGVWDLFETTKSAAQEAHKRMYGYYFPEIEANPVQTPFGEYRGGYAPAVTDKMMNPDGGRFEAEQVMSQQSNAAMFPSAEKGFTQGRVEYNRPLDLAMSRIPAHLDRVMKFAHLGPAVRNAARLVKNRAFSDAIRAASPDVIDVAVIPWLQRTVQQRVTTPPTNAGWGGVDKIAQAINNRVGLHLMAGNILNAAQQTTGFSVAAAVVPVRHLVAALSTFRVNGQGARAHMVSRSAFMAERMSNGANEVATTLANYLSEGSMLSAPGRAAERVGYIAQQVAQNLIDPTVWLAAERYGMTTVYPDVYAKELDQTGDEAAADDAATKAVTFYADSVVRQTQAPLRPSDISAIEASSPMARLFLKFYSYFNAMGNLLVTERNIAQNAKIGWTSRQGRAFYAYLMIIAVPSIVAESMTQGLRGGFDDLEDEDEVDQLMFEIIIGSQLKTTMAMVPYVGQIGGLVYGVATTDTVNDDRLNLPAGLSVVSGTVSSLTKLIMVAADPDTDVDTKKAIKTTLDAFALVTGIPTNWLSKPLQYAAEVHAGKSKPEGMVDILQGALTGKDGTE